MPVVTTIEGQAQLRDKLGRFGPNAKREANAILKDVANHTRDRARQLAPNDTGAGAAHILVRTHDLSAEVISPDNYMVVMEFGRRPGATPPSTNQIRSWGLRHGFTEHSLFVLARAIGRNGIRAHKFMTKAAQEADILIRQRLAVAGVHMEQWWSRR